jgi:pilus assembly protein CpaB
MTFRTVLILLLALVFGLSAALSVNFFLRKPQAPDRPETVTIVVASGNVPRFGTLSANDLKIREIPSDMVPSGALTQVEDAVDRAVYNGLVRDEIVLEGKLSAKGAGRGMATAIPKGMRAFTISTTTLASGVAGFILPGSRVDVLLTVTRSGQNDPTGGGQTSTLLQDIEILAVDQIVKAPADNRVDPKELRSVTLLVTPQQAAKLDLGQNKGILHLTLRNPEDETYVATRPATLNDLGLYAEAPKPEVKEPEKKVVTAPVPPPPAAPPALPARIRVIRGALESGGVEFEPIDPGRGGG